MATYVNNLGMAKGTHLIEGATLMPKWEDRSGIPISQSKINLLPKNVAQDPMDAKGPIFDLHGNPDTFNLHPMLHEKIDESEYYKCLFVFKTFDKVVDVIYEKVTYVEPWAAGSTRSPSSAYCLLLKLFHLRLTEIQVKALLDHGDSPYIRALGALYVRYGCAPERTWHWLGHYADDLEEFAPGLNPNQTTTFGAYCVKLMTDLQYFSTMLPRIPVAIERRLKALEPGAAVRAIYRDEERDPAWYDAEVVSCVEPYEGAPEGMLPSYVVTFGDAVVPGGARETVKLGQLDFAAAPAEQDGKRRDRREHRDRDRSRRDRDDGRDRDRAAATVASRDGDRRRRGSGGGDDDGDRRRRRSRSRDRREHRDRDRSRRDRAATRPSRRDRSRDRDRSRRDRSRDREPRDKGDAAPAPAEGVSLLAGRDILGDVIRRERDLAVADHRGDVHKRPIGYNTALIVPADRFSYRQRSRSKSPAKARYVAPTLADAAPRGGGGGRAADDADDAAEAEEEPKPRRQDDRRRNADLEDEYGDASARRD
ncbi:hypothetical protein JL720_10130 [Aureococcus anophagefferens]|nr:hypothetical protein JL720_10130 [Aureococcus anophagefferens]